MFLMRTFDSVNMNDLRLLVFVVALQGLLAPISCGGHHYRRSTAAQGGLALSNGWRPVIGTGGLLYGAYNNPQLHSQTYKLPMQVLDLYQSSSRPVPGKDSTKLSSIAQSYRPTTLKAVSAASIVPAANQPISTYHNPFTVQNNAFGYKFVQNYPGQSVPVRNPHNPYADRTVYTKYPTKFKQNSHGQNAMLQQFSHLQPLQFAQYQPAVKQIENYVRPNEGNKHQSSNIELYKPEVFKLDNDAAPQSANQYVQTAQQHTLSGSPNVGNQYPQYTLQDSLLPPNVLGAFGTFGIKSVKGRDPLYQFQTTFGPSTSQQTKQPLYNSYNFSPTYKTTKSVFDAITPRAPVTISQYSFGTHSDFKSTSTPQTKLYVPPKIDPNADVKGGFKPSPQDPYNTHNNNKNYQSNFNKVYVSRNPPIQTTTLANNYYQYNFPSRQTPATEIYQNDKNNYANIDSVLAGNQQHVPANPYSASALGAYRVTYDVTETTESELGNKFPTPWSVTEKVYDTVQKSTPGSDTKQELVEVNTKPVATTTSDLPEEYAIVTEAEKGYSNGYDDRVESQSRRPQSDEFEPIAAHKLKDYYYKLSTPVYEQYSTMRRTKPTEATTQETTTQVNYNQENKGEQIDVTLPTLPPTQHYRRPAVSDLTEKEKVRKRNKIRRRRPQGAGIPNRNREETSRFTTSTVSTTSAAPTVTEEYTIRPRTRTTQSQLNLTTPTVTTDLTTSVLPTISPTIPTIVKKKLAHRRPPPSSPATTPIRPETTTPAFTQDYLRKDSQDSQIMKITNRPYLPKLTYDFTDDFTHKQDEKDTPTSDVTVSLSAESLKATSDNDNRKFESEPEFSFHKDFKPIEAKMEPITSLYKQTTPVVYKEETSEYATTPRIEITTIEVSQGPRIRNKFQRNKFNVKDYRSRLNSTTTTTEKPVDGVSKVRFSQRRQPYFDIENETTTERKKFIPKDPRHKLANTTEQPERNTHSPNSYRQRATTTDSTEPTVKTSSRPRNGQRRRPTEETTQPTTILTKRPLRNRYADSEVGESVQDITIVENIGSETNDITSERTRSESAIMKIADKKHQDHIEHLFEHSRRVSDLTLAASKDYSKPGLFKTVSTISRRVPNYFTIATDDPILPIEAFFPQLNQRKES